MNDAQAQQILNTLNEIKIILEQMNSNIGMLQNDVHYIKIDTEALVKKLVESSE